MAKRRSDDGRKRTAPTSTSSSSLDDIPGEWREWLCRGNRCSRRKGKRYPKRNVVAAVRAQLDSDSNLDGYWSGIRLDPTIDETDPFYPSVDHVAGRDNKHQIVVETRIVNDMKSALSEQDFWILVNRVHQRGRKRGMITAAMETDSPSWKPSMSFSGSRKKRRV